MIKFNKNIWFVYVVICFLFIFNITLLFKIPFFLSILGLIALFIVPGFLLCLLLSIKVTDRCENFLYIIGLSIIFDILFGLISNTFLPFFGVNHPLSSQNLQFWFSVIIIILTSLIIYTDNSPVISFRKFKIIKIEKLFLIFGFIILLCFVISIFLVNANITNLFLIFSIFLIPILLIFLIIYHNDSTKHIYPLIIYLISFSLLLLLPLRSNYIIGVDSHAEYFLFYTTFINSVWTSEPLLLSSALSITILPTVFEKFLNIDPQMLFKLLYPLIFSITPLIIYVIVKKYVNELLALIASCFFMFQLTFILTSAISRTSVAIFFFAFTVLVICDIELSNTKKYILALLFITGSILSHYTSSIIFFILIFSTYILELLFDRFKFRNENRFFNFPLIIFFLSMMFFWYVQIIKDVFNTGTEFLFERIEIISDSIKNDVSNYIPHSPPNPSLIIRFSNYSRLVLYFFIGFGILFAFYCWVQKEIKGNSFPQFSIKINRTLLFMGVIAFIFLYVIVFGQFLFYHGYEGGRFSQLIFVVLSLFLVVGASNFFNLILWQENLHFSKMEFHKQILPIINYLKSNQIKIVSGIILFLIIPELLIATGITSPLNTGQDSVILNSPKYSKNMYQLGYYYIFDQDAITLRWFKKNSDKNAQIFSDDIGNAKITSTINQRSTLYQKDFLLINEENVLKGYIFLTVTNEYWDTYSTFIAYGLENQMSAIRYILNQKNKIYANGAVLYK